MTDQYACRPTFTRISDRHSLNSELEIIFLPNNPTLLEGRNMMEKLKSCPSNDNSVRFRWPHINCKTLTLFQHCTRCTLYRLISQTFLKESVSPHTFLKESVRTVFIRQRNDFNGQWTGFILQQTGFIRQQTGFIGQLIVYMSQRMKPVCWQLKRVRWPIKPVRWQINPMILIVWATVENIRVIVIKLSRLESLLGAYTVLRGSVNYPYGFSLGKHSVAKAWGLLTLGFAASGLHMKNSPGALTLPLSTVQCEHPWHSP